jgi:hypothetical protein
MSPPPTPTSPVTNRTWSWPIAAPRRCSASAPRSASFATVTGTSNPSAGHEPLARTARRASRGSGPSRRSRRSAGRRPRPPRRRRRAPPAARIPEQPSRQLGDLGDRLVDRRGPAGPFDADDLEDVAAQPDDGCRQRVDVDLDGQHDQGLGVRPDDRRRPARRAPERRPFLADEVRGEELAKQGSDRAAGQPDPGDEHRARARPVGMELADDRAEVGPADGLAPLADGRRSDRGRFCVPLFQNV